MRPLQPTPLRAPAYTPSGLATKSYLTKGWDFNRYGFRVPFIVISPFGKKHDVSHKIADNTSVLRFIEKRFDLPPLAARDAAAHDLMDMFLFEEEDAPVLP